MLIKIRLFWDTTPLQFVKTEILGELAVPPSCVLTVHCYISFNNCPLFIVIAFDSPYLERSLINVLLPCLRDELFKLSYLFTQIGDCFLFNWLTLILHSTRLANVIGNMESGAGHDRFRTEDFCHLVFITETVNISTESSVRIESALRYSMKARRVWTTLL
jgi:hypothetical protein